MDVIDLGSQPGPLIRRLQSLHAAIFATVLGDEVTSPQFGLLCVVATDGHVDQGEALVLANLDRSTGADVAARLHRRGLLVQEIDPNDSRRRVLSLTPDGEALLERLMPSAAAVGDRLLAALDQSERATLIELMSRIISRSTDPDPQSSDPKPVSELAG